MVLRGQGADKHRASGEARMLLKKRPKSQKFVHLHNHTEFSFLDAIVTVKGLGQKLKSKGFTSYAITDHGNMNGVYRFVTDLKKAGVKPIVGCEYYYVEDRHQRGLSDERKAEIKEGYKGQDARARLREAEKEAGVRDRYHLVILAKDHEGFRLMIRAMELAYQEGFYYFPRIDWELLQTMAGHVIVSSACISGVPAKLLENGHRDEAFEWCSRVHGVFGEDFYLEVQPNEIDKQIKYNLTLIDFADELGCEIVATNDVHYIEREHWESHDVLLALRESQRGKKVLVSDQDRFRYTTHELYLKTRLEMEQSFKMFHPEFPEDRWARALDVTMEIDAKIEPDVLRYRKGILPKIHVEDEYGNDPNKKLWDLVKKGWKWRKIKEKSLGKFGEVDWIEGEMPRKAPLYTVYKECVKYEMDEILRLGFAKYFLVIHDLIWWARDNGIRPGPGRGSVAGSIVAYLLGITSVDSIRWKCPFSRFISPDRIDYPDIDMDFPTVDRKRVKEYLVEKYGHDQVASICNYSTMKGKMVLKDVGRVFGVPYGETEAVVGHIIQRASGDARGSACLEDTFREFKECREYLKKYPEVVRHAIILEGNSRQLGVNAAGMVVTDEPIRNMVPVQYQIVRDNKGGKRGEYVTSWDKREVEEVGLLKLDVLGIEGLTYIQRTIDLIKARTGEDIEPEDWEDFDDPAVYKEFQEGNTELVWQMNTQGAIRVLKKLKPDRFEHLIAATSLIRPGPLYAGITADYIKRRHGATVKSVHPMLDHILRDTYGLCIYQEGATKIVHDMAGFSWAQADAVRKCISKKMGKEYMQKHKELFFSGSAERGIEGKTAERIWDSIGQFGQYAFNRAHACSYSHLSYWTMWFKIYHPLEFMTAALESEENADKRRAYIRESKRLGLTVAAPDVNVSGSSFTIDDRFRNTIRVGFVDIKGVGEKTVASITAGAPYKSFHDFIARAKVNKKVVEVMLKVGAFDTICPNPKQMDDNLETILLARKRKDPTAYLENLELPDGPKTYTIEERERLQLELLALPPSQHPSIFYRDWVEKNCPWLTPRRIAEYPDLFESEFSTTHQCFMGVCTRVQFQNIATQMSVEERTKLKEELGAFADKMEGTERRIKLNLEDDTDFLMAMSTPGQYAAMDEGKVKEGMVFLGIGRSVGDFRISTSLLINMTDMLEKLNAGHEFPPDAPEQVLLRNPFADTKEGIVSSDLFKPLGKGLGRFRTAVYIMEATERKTKAHGTMLVCGVMDWTGNIRDLTVWPDDYRKFKSFFKIGESLALWVEVKSGNGRSRRYIADISSRSGRARIARLANVLQ